MSAPPASPGAGEALDAVDEVALEVVGFAGHVEVGETAADLVEGDGDLATGEVRAG